MEFNTILNIILIALIFWFLYKRLAPVGNLENLNSDQLAERLKNKKDKVLIDVREPNEFKSGHIPGAKNIPLSQIKTRLDEIPEDKEVILYCRSGMRSKQAARIVSKKNPAKLSHLAGGILTWKGKTVK
ncbi:MAG: rhodanese-like domain-containing protein [Bacillaceae bacterium]|nr:rhodanese-like domain-containing protein [Bacillaceae bacterium]